MRGHARKICINYVKNPPLFAVLTHLSVFFYLVLPVSAHLILAYCRPCILSTGGHTFMHIYPFYMHIGIKAGVFMNITPTYVFPRNTPALFSLWFQPVNLAVHVLRTYQNCIFLSLFVTFDGFHPFFSPSCSFCMPLFVTSAQTALSSARFGLILVVLTNRILSSYRKGFDIPATAIGLSVHHILYYI